MAVATYTRAASGAAAFGVWAINIDAATSATAVPKYSMEVRFTRFIYPASRVESPWLRFLRTRPSKRLRVANSLAFKPRVARMRTRFTHSTILIQTGLAEG